MQNLYLSALWNVDQNVQKSNPLGNIYLSIQSVYNLYNFVQMNISDISCVSGERLKAPWASWRDQLFQIKFHNYLINNMYFS